MHFQGEQPAAWLGVVTRGDAQDGYDSAMLEEGESSVGCWVVWATRQGARVGRGCWIGK
jgi:hypothetical protein